MNRKLVDACQSSAETSASTTITARQRILRLPEVCAVTGLGRSFSTSFRLAEASRSESREACGPFDLLPRIPWQLARVPNWD
jgi:hypothetical protein